MIMQTSCIYLPNARYLDIHVYMAWSHRDPRCRSFRHERALDCCTSDHVFERLLHKSGNTATIQPNQTTSRELSRERWHRIRKVLICPPSPNSCKLICLLNKEICVNIFSSCPHQNCWSNYHFHHFSWNKSTSNTVYTLQCQNRLTWTCFWRAVLDFADCSITVFPAIGWCRIWTIPSAMSGSVLTADTAWAPVWPLCPLAIYSCTNDKGRQKWVSFLANKSRNINAVPTVQKFGRRGVK